MPSAPTTSAYVWIWLPEETEPVVAGRLDDRGDVVTFTYGQSYLDRADAIALYLPDLPLRRGTQAPAAGSVHGCISDASPDAWGRRLIELGWGEEVDPAPLDYLLASGSDRVGGLDFQASGTEYQPRTPPPTTLEELSRAAERVEGDEPLGPELETILLHGTSIGGVRPKAAIVDENHHLIAKFRSTTDTRPVVESEFIAMSLAARAGLDVAPVELAWIAGTPVLLVERFDRTAGGHRRLMVSARTILQLGEFGLGASYADLADELRSRGTDHEAALRELFGRICFNILVGNTDDHAKNHAAFWNGEELDLTPAYDICPQVRTTGEASQAMAIGPSGDRLSNLDGAARCAATYQLDEHEAREIVERQAQAISDGWDEVCDAARLGRPQRDELWGRQFLNPFAFEGW